MLRYDQNKDSTVQYERYERTRQLFRMALRRGARGTGSSAGFLDRRTAVQPIPDLTLMGTIPWVLVGGIALRAYMPERMTQDVDILIHAQDEQAARAAFLQAGYTITGPLAIGGFTAHPPSGMPIDVLTSTAPWLDQAFAHPGRDAAGYAVLPRPYLMLLKMQAGRPQDWVDVQRMLRDTPAAERAATRTLIGRYAPDLVEDYDSLITLADWEFGSDV
jgi:hypothetical protein